MSHRSTQAPDADACGRPAPLPEPAVADIRLEAVMAALSDPLRLTIVRRLLLESDAYDHPCGWFDLGRPKSSLTHHFRALREAGLIRQRQYGLERRSMIRAEDLEERFPGLLQMVKNWHGPEKTYTAAAGHLSPPALTPPVTWRSS